MSYREDDICVIEFLHAPSGVTLNEAGDSGNVAGTRGGYSQVLRGAPSCWLPPGVGMEEWKVAVQGGPSSFSEDLYGESAFLWGGTKLQKWILALILKIGYCTLFVAYYLKSSS